MSVLVKLVNVWSHTIAVTWVTLVWQWWYGGKLVSKGTADS